MFRQSLRTSDFESAMQDAKELCFDLHSKMKSGKKLFAGGISLGQLVSTFVEYKRGDNITRERVSSIKTYLKPLLRFKGEKLPIAELSRKALFDYARWRRIDKPSIAQVTIEQEQSTINSLMKFAYREEYVSFEQFEFAKLPTSEVGRRDTFTLGEFSKLHTYMHGDWIGQCAKDERTDRLLLRDAILFLSDSMLRVGEFHQLRWNDIVKIYDDIDVSKRRMCLAEIKIRAETSKVRKSRTTTTRGGEYLKKMRERRTDWKPDDYVFCGASGSIMFNEKRANAAWAQLMAAIGVDYKARKITWYSLRHYGITRMLASGVPSIHVANLAGTTITYIDKHYAHVDQSMARNAARQALRIVRTRYTLNR